MGGGVMRTYKIAIDECSFKNKIRKPRIRYCCEVLIDFRTCLLPAPKHFHDIKVTSKVDVKIDKVCACKVILGGILHKTIKYTVKNECNSCCDEYVKHKDIPFSCFIDVDCADENDCFKIVGYEILCDFSELIKIKEECNLKTIFVEKDIIKIAVQRHD
jgi:hypothetical protein